VSAAGDVTGTITAAARSVDTKHNRRAEHLRSADFFDVANHRDITFTVDGIRPDNGGVNGQPHRPRPDPPSAAAKVSSTDGEVTLDDELTDRESRTPGGRAAARRGSQG